MVKYNYLTYASLSAFGAGMSGMTALTASLMNISDHLALEAVVLQSEFQKGENTILEAHINMLEKVISSFGDNHELLSYSILLGGVAATLSVLSLYFLKKSD